MQNSCVGELPQWGPCRVDWSNGVITAISPLADGDDLPLLVPGLIDLQVNGYAGIDVNDTRVSSERLAEITAALARAGTTTWLPTLVTAPESAICQALAVLQAAVRTDPTLAQAIPAVHIEGPFISPEVGARGCHDPAQIRPLDLAEVARWRRHWSGPLLLTVSPHHHGDAERIRALLATSTAQSSLKVSIGHTSATPAQISAAIDAGATMATHLGNGIAGLLPRHPNPIWTLLDDARVHAGVIADGHHLPDEVLRVFAAAKADRLFLVSDATESAGRAPGRYRTAVGGEVELSPDGRLSFAGTEFLAGAAVGLGAGVRTMIAAGLPWQHAIGLATTGVVSAWPEVLGDRGELRVGARADLLLLDRQTYEPFQVMRGGVVETFV